jgi:predicted RNase H-like HicB family nuclease
MPHHTHPISFEQKDGQYFAYSADLPGVYGLGDSIEEARNGMLDGIRVYILECKKGGKPIPASRTILSETVSVAID